MKKKILKLTMGVVPVLGVLSILSHGGCHKPVPAAAAAQGALVVAPSEHQTAEPGEAPTPKAEAKEDDDKGTKVEISDKVVADAHVRMEPAVQEVLVSKLSVPGEIVADPDKSARVTSPVAGRVEHIAFKEGDTVKKGDVLAIVRVPELGKARASQASTSSRATAARSNADRLRELADKGLAAKQDAVNAEVEASALSREAQAAQEQLGAIGSAVGGAGSELALRAPISGVVTRRSAVVGQAVTAEDTIATIVDLREVWFLGRVYEKDLARIELGRTAAVATAAFPKEAFSGTVEYLGREADPGARTFSARIRLDNPRGLLRVGLFGTARIDTTDGATEARVVVPRSAITEMDSKPVAFVKKGTSFEKRLVVLGAHDNRDIEIVSGIDQGEAVVVDGTFNVKSVFLKGTLGDDD